MSVQIKDDQVLIKDARIGYPKLFRPEAIKNLPDSKPRYGCAIYLKKSDKKTGGRIQRIVDELIKSKLDGVKPKTKDMCITDGDGEDGDENTAGCYIISANRAERQRMPQVIDRDRTQLGEDDGRIYAGCRCNFLVSFYVPKGWSKIAASLEIVQFWGDDEPFGTARPDADVMPEYGDENDDDDEVAL